LSDIQLSEQRNLRMRKSMLSKKTGPAGVGEIWRDFNVLPYIACPRYPYIRVYRLCDRGGTEMQLW